MLIKILNLMIQATTSSESGSLSHEQLTDMSNEALMKTYFKVS